MQHFEEPPADKSDEKLIAQIVRKVPGGFLIRLNESPAFLPNSFLDQKLQSSSDELLEMVFECQLVLTNGKYPPVVKPIGPFLTFDDWMASNAKGRD
jgi:ribosomal protein S1